jgi:hypothetical protein
LKIDDRNQNSWPEKILRLMGQPVAMAACRQTKPPTPFQLLRNPFIKFACHLGSAPVCSYFAARSCSP